MRRRAIDLLLILLFFGDIAVVYPREESSEGSRVCTPAFSHLGMVFTNAASSALFISQGNSPAHLLSAPGCGYYYSLSFEQSLLGLKLIGNDGLQAPAVIDLTTGRTTTLHQPEPMVGQVSFTSDGRTAFTVGHQLIVTDGKEISKYDLGVYSNLAPISPNGNYIAYNDAEDQIWLLSVSTGERIKITDSQFGYCCPAWSQNSQRLLYSSLNGLLKVYDVPSMHTFMLGEAFSPSWSHDSQWIVYYKKEITNLQLVNSDIYLSRFDGSRTRRLTNSADVFEMDPTFLDNDFGIAYCVGSTLYKAGISPDRSSLQRIEQLTTLPPSLQHGIENDRFIPRVDGILVPPSTNFDMPYINQVYDTPDWFNGHSACGPTTAMMVLAHYSILPRWDVWCSGPSGHTSPWGRYISDAYNFKARFYGSMAPDPNGRPAAGAFGFMWASASPYSTMASYYSYHGIPSSTVDGPPHSAGIAEISAGYPYSMCVGLTSAGHIVAAHGLGPEMHTIIVNDPYGNKNMPGYPNYYGKNAQYDWPGYNNGNQNFVHVYWCTTTHGTQPVAADTLVDDLQFENGFTLHTQAPASMTLWKDMNRGYGNHLWYTFTRAPGSADTCYALWTPSLFADGFYEVSAYIALSEATAARYTVFHAGVSDTILVNQKEITDAWVSLGTYRFEKGKSGYVILGDGSPVRGQAIVFDAMRWSYRGTTMDVAGSDRQQIPVGFELGQNFPNPFNPTTVVRYQLPVASRVRLVVYDLMGREVAVLANERREAGAHEVKFDGSNLASGIYFCRLTAGDFVQSKKLLLQK